MIDEYAECLAINLTIYVITAVYRPTQWNKQCIFSYSDGMFSYICSCELPNVLMGYVSMNTITCYTCTLESSDIISLFGQIKMVMLPRRITRNAAAFINIRVINLPYNYTVSSMLSSSSSHLMTVTSCFSSTLSELYDV